jgi:hypothetical protein
MTVERGNAGDGGKDSPDFQHEGEGSIFSQNLELEFNSPAMHPAGRDNSGFAGNEPEPEERMTFFQVEAAKVVEILREELERFGASEGNLEKIDQLWLGWCELWGAEQGLVELEFTAMFRVVRVACDAASCRGKAALAQPEKLALSRLMQGMEKLAGGQSDEEDLQWCRETGNRVLRMIAAWDNVEESGELESRPLPQQDEDISGSIDEWFSQVSRFIPHTPETEQKTDIPSSAEPTSLPDNELELVEPEPEYLLKQSSASLDSSEIEEINEGDVEQLEDEPIVRQAPIETIDTVAPVSVQTAAEEDGVAQQPETARAGGEPEDIVEEGASEGWLSEMYFSQCCHEAAEAIRNNADRLEGTSATRTARMLRDWVEYLLCLSADFGVIEADEALEALWSRLEEILAGDANSSSGDAEKVEELLSALSNLERECERVVVAAC